MNASGRWNIDWTIMWTSLLCGSAVVSSVLMVFFGPRPEWSFLAIFVLAVTLVAATLDTATRRIPNGLTYPAISIALLVNGLGFAAGELGYARFVAWAGTPEIWLVLLGFGLFGLVGLFGLLFGDMGGGDWKLLTAIGAALGLDVAMYILVFSMIMALAIVLLDFIWNRQLLAMLQRHVLSLTGPLVAADPPTEPATQPAIPTPAEPPAAALQTDGTAAKPREKPMIPLGIALAGGVIAALAMQTV